MAENTVKLHYNVDADDFTVAGEASGAVKKVLKQLGFSPEVIRRVAVAMYECEINMVIHANGGHIDVEITPEKIRMIHTDEGPGIKDIDKAMQEGYSTADEKVRELGFGAGMGLPNMKRYTDDMKITTEVGVGTVVDMTVFVNK
ncbi:MAG: anti-sigma regulatory factor [Ruminococcaceae bacterium]|nr:anti-sigma regulatory factor [Oscillospiraceae bacterium]